MTHVDQAAPADAPAPAVARLLLDFSAPPVSIADSPAEALAEVFDDLCMALAVMNEQGIPDDYILPLVALRAEAIALIVTPRAENRVIVDAFIARLQVGCDHVLAAIDAAQAGAHA